ncbi:ATP-binding protein [Azospirillum soli]|uniref:ATP-binding protein n=1 Tax=Azospirillum soli TaxID=1304799 RepID=UPI001AE2033C|nr:AAA family ATPase [Azospirillum soli]MBP2314559.1 DNA-binding SARP family transcriptional activator [Azospirillum soli]
MLAIRLLGEIDVLREGERLSLPPSKKTRALLAYLALTGRPHRRERLCSLLWEIPDDPRGALRWSLSKLRTLVDEPDRPRIRADRELVGFDAAGADIDILSVRRALAGGVELLDTDRLRSLAGAFRGELLEGQDLPDLHDYQAWCVAEREDARRLQAQILAALVERLNGQPEDALPFARTLVREHPYDEAARISLLRLLGAADRRGEAEQQYEAGQRILREAGLGSAALTAAWRALKGGSPQKSAPQPDLPREPPVAPCAPAPCAPANGAGLIGRRSEMRRLLAALGEVEGVGGARVILLKGEPGLGKSALTLTLARTAASRTGAVLLGHAYEVERDQPFGPWIEALDGLPAVEAAVGGSVPDLGRHTDVVVARERLFAAVVETVAERARRRPPLLLVLEDIHWLDEASAALLHHVVRALRRAPVMVVLTAREGELPDNPPVLGVLRSLRHDRLLTEVALGPMPQEEIAALARSVASDIDAQRVVIESGGNPLLAQEMARALAEGADGVPRTLRGLVRDRIERLPEPAADVLRWAAILGPGVSIDRLGKLIAMDLTGFMAALDTLERHALLQEAEDGGETGGYAFRHDLIHRAVYTGLSEPRRRLMHLKIARMLQETEPTDDAVAAEIAHHAALGGDGALAAQACLTAGRHCLRLLAGAEAEVFARRGMRHAERLREPERTRFMLELQYIQLMASRPLAPAETVRQIEELSERALDHGCLHHARLGFHMLSHLRWEGGLWSQAERDTLRAELVSRSADEKVRVVALAEAARCLTLLERDLGQAEAFALEARALAQRQGIEPNAIADALGMLRLHQGATHEAATLFAQARAAARRDGERAAEFMALEHMVAMEIREGSIDRAEALCAELIDLADRLRHDGSEAPYARALSALCRRARGDAGADGDLNAALDALTVADAKHRLACTLIFAADLDRRAGQHVRARDRAQEALRLAVLLDLPSEMACAHAALARIAEAVGDETARREHSEALRRLMARNLSHHARSEAETLAPHASDINADVTG